MVQALDKTIEYVYNGIGNIVSVKTYDYTPKGTEPSGTPVTKSFTYSTSRPDRLTNYNGSIVAYSSMGCPTTFNGMSATWTRGKLSSITKGTIRTDRYNYAFQYNALGQRIEKSYTRVPPLNGISSLQAGDVTNYTKQYVYDHSGRLIQEATNGTKHEVGAYSETLKYLYDESGMIGFEYSNGTNENAYYYQRNLLGDVIGIYDVNGNKVVEYAYDAYGNCTIKGTTTNYVIAYANPIRYRGYYYDEDTNLYYLNARYYSPEFRRFISPDDTSYLDPESVNGLNLYCYCGNDPINFVDPSGHAPKWLQGLAIGLAIVGAVLVVGAVTVLTCGVGTLAGTLAGAVIYGAAQGIAIGAAVGVVGGGILGGIASDWSAEGILIGMGIGLGAGAIFGGVIGGFAGANGWYNARALEFTNLGTNDEVVLGKYIHNSPHSYDAVAKSRGSTYFGTSQTRWAEVQNMFGVGEKGMWRINKAFLKQQINAGKQFVITNDYIYGYLFEEVSYITSKGISLALI